MGLFLCANSVWASTGSVVQVKGKKAIVQFDNPPKVGDSVSTGSETGMGSLDGSSATDAGRFKFSKSSRKYSLIYSANASFLSTSGTTSSSIAFNNPNLQLGYILGKFEFGPILGFSSSALSSSTQSSFSLGAYGGYDFTESKPGVETVPSVYAKLISTSASGSGSTSSTLIGVGGEVDEYLADRIAVLAYVEYDAISYSNTSASGFFVGTGFKITF